jgi:hypothetical protein
MINHVVLYPSGYKQDVFPLVVSKALGIDINSIMDILLKYIPKDEKGIYKFSGKSFKESWRELGELSRKRLEDISKLCFTQYSPSLPKRKMTLGTFLTKFNHGVFITMLDNGYTVLIENGILHANEGIALKPKSRVFKAYKVIGT